MKTILGGMLMAALIATSAEAAVRTEKVEYRHGDAVLEGFLAYDDSMAGKRPGVLVVHEWWGLNDYAKRRAEELARLGYVAFALDMYGKGKVATHPKDAEAFMTEATRDPAVTTARFNAALEQLKRDPHVDPDQIAAIGYCFGGGVVLGMARSGADLDAVVTFHGHLATKTPAEKGKIKARILVLTGADDPAPAGGGVQERDDGRGGEVRGDQLSGGEAQLHEPSGGQDRDGRSGVQRGRRREVLGRHAGSVPSGLPLKGVATMVPARAQGRGERRRDRRGDLRVDGLGGGGRLEPRRPDAPVPRRASGDVTHLEQQKMPPRQEPIAPPQSASVLQGYPQLQRQMRPKAGMRSGVVPPVESARHTPPSAKSRTGIWASVGACAQSSGLGI